jgi:glycosyltransferase involved in cell wall biosynthesis
MRILFLSRWFPYPPNNGSKLRAYNLLRTLAAGHDVVLLSFAGESEEPAAPVLRRLCREVQVVPWKPYQPRAWRARLGALSWKPRSVVDTFSRQMEACLVRAIAGGGFDLVIASGLDMAGYARHFAGLRALFDEVEVGVLHDQCAGSTSVARRFRFGLTWAKHRRYLARVLSHFRACTVASERERELLSAAVPGHPPIELIPNCVDLGDYGDTGRVPEPATLIFTGSLSYFANHDAMRWFLRDIYPAIETQVPRVRLTITGDAAGCALPAADNVVLTGLVGDVRPLVASSWVSVAPVRIGGGTRLKIIEAMALGTPVVSTAKGAEGLDVVHGEHLLIGDSAEEFAAHVVGLLSDRDLRERLSRSARRLVEVRYDWCAVGRRFEELVARVGAGGGASRAACM